MQTPNLHLPSIIYNDDTQQTVQIYEMNETGSGVIFCERLYHVKAYK